MCTPSSNRFAVLIVDDDEQVDNSYHHAKEETSYRVAVVSDTSSASEVESETDDDGNAEDAEPSSLEESPEFHALSRRPCNQPSHLKVPTLKDEPEKSTCEANSCKEQTDASGSQEETWAEHTTRKQRLHLAQTSLRKANKQKVLLLGKSSAWTKRNTDRHLNPSQAPKAVWDDKEKSFDQSHPLFHDLRVGEPDRATCTAYTAKAKQWLSCKKEGGHFKAALDILVSEIAYKRRKRMVTLADCLQQAAESLGVEFASFRLVYVSREGVENCDDLLLPINQPTMSDSLRQVYCAHFRCSLSQTTRFFFRLSKHAIRALQEADACTANDTGHRSQDATSAADDDDDEGQLEDVDRDQETASEDLKCTEAEQDPVWAFYGAPISDSCVALGKELETFKSTLQAQVERRYQYRSFIVSNTDIELVALSRRFIETHVNFDVPFFKVIQNLASKAGDEWIEPHPFRGKVTDNASSSGSSSAGRWRSKSRIEVLAHLVDTTFKRQFRSGQILHVKGTIEDEACQLGFLHLCLTDALGRAMFMKLEYDPDMTPIYDFCAFVHEDQLPDSLTSSPPKPPVWFSRLEETVFDATKPVKLNSEHIFEDNWERIKREARVSSRPEAEAWFNKQFDVVRRKARFNSRLAVPQYYDDKLQFLLPLFQQRRLVLVLVADPIFEEGQLSHYTITTILLPAWAYSSARVIGPVESSWLVPPYDSKPSVNSLPLLRAEAPPFERN